MSSKRERAAQWAVTRIGDRYLVGQGRLLATDRFGGINPHSATIRGEEQRARRLLNGWPTAFPEADVAEKGDAGRQEAAAQSHESDRTNGLS